MSSKRQTNSAGLRRDIELLQVLGRHEVEHRSGLGVIRIAELAGREKTQVSRALATLAEQGLVAAECLYIGDTSHDEQAAAAAGVRFVAVAWGYGVGAQQVSESARLLIAPTQLLTL